MSVFLEGGAPADSQENHKRSFFQSHSRHTLVRSFLSTILPESPVSRDWGKGQDCSQKLVKAEVNLRGRSLQRHQLGYGSGRDSWHTTLVLWSLPDHPRLSRQAPLKVLEVLEGSREGGGRQDGRTGWVSLVSFPLFFDRSL